MTDTNRKSTTRSRTAGKTQAAAEMQASSADLQALMPWLAWAYEQVAS